MQRTGKHGITKRSTASRSLMKYLPIAFIGLIVCVFYAVSTEYTKLNQIKATKAQREKLAHKKEQQCQINYKLSREALDLIQVATLPKSSTKWPKVLCFVNTIEPHHHTRVQAIKDTWGQRCDKLLFLSNVTDEQVGTIKIDAPSDHNHLWQKHKASLRYVWEHYQNDYDWFYKADDDAYVIMENLKQYLSSTDIQERVYIDPMQLGHRFSLPEKMIDYYVVDKRLRSDFKHVTGSKWTFNSGGPGYAMNYLYMKKIVGSLDQRTCLSDKYSVMLPDDAAISFCMAFYNIYPKNTRDENGLERFHVDKPSGTYYGGYEQRSPWMLEYHEDIGGINTREKCCSPESIAFHYVTPDIMYFMEQSLYFCRAPDLTLHEYNQRNNLKIAGRVFQVRKPASAAKASKKVSKHHN